MTARATSTSGAPTARCTSSTWLPGLTRSRCRRPPSQARSATRPSTGISAVSTWAAPTAISTLSRRRSREGVMASRRKIVQGVGGILLLLCGAAIGPHGQPGAAEGAPPTVQVREVFFGEREETVCQPGRREFVLDDLQGLSVCIVWSGLEGTYWTQLTFVSPDGHVYQKMTQAFVTPEARATVATVEVQGQQHGVKRAGRGRKGESVVVATLPVAGTYITQHNLTGLWTVKISLNGRPVDEDHFVLHARQ